MIDIHHHIVYGVDDGAQLWEDSRQMLIAAYNQGVHHIVATSHIAPGRRHFDQAAYFRHLEKLQIYAQDSGLDIMVHPGNEIMYTSYTCEYLRKGRALTLDGTDNVLVEFMPEERFEVLYRAAQELGNAGYNVVFAHVERYDCLHKGDALRRLRDECMVTTQMNASTILRTKGLFGDRWARNALREGLIDIAASDAHNTEKRACQMRACKDLLNIEYGRALCKNLCRTNPKMLLAE